MISQPASSFIEDTAIMLTKLLKRYHLLPRLSPWVPVVATTMLMPYFENLPTAISLVLKEKVQCGSMIPYLRC
ncbi:MAG: hypothetical protein KJ706_00425, partial [Candidatus Omnitrophica bacterium]|nr:hypothetical protein [Candidatus Omnitrophota bacterium]